MDIPSEIDLQIKFQRPKKSEYIQPFCIFAT